MSPISRRTFTTSFRVGCLAICTAVSLAACGESDDSEPPATNAGSAGTPSAGTNSGRGGDNTGGQSRGGQGSAGETGGSSGSSGSSGSGGAGGDQSSAGSPGAGGDQGAAGAGSLDDCFEGLREPVGNYQDAQKDSADMSYRMRLVLETADRFGTSGTMPWLPIRLALQTPERTFCISDEVLLADAYTTSHHNCDDVLTFTDGDLEYTITTPDTAIDQAAPSTWIRPSDLTIKQGDTTIAGPIRLDTVACYATDFPDGYCRSGGPC